MALLCMVAAPAFAETARDATELARTYKGALVYIPGGQGAEQGTVADLAVHLFDVPAVVLYMHGCSGLIEIAHAAGRMYVEAGYVFVAPDSFARSDKPVSCRPEGPEGGLHRAVLSWRQAEVGHAIAQIRALTQAGKRDPWFRLPVLRGDCGEFMDTNDRSVVFTAPDPLFDQHWTSGDAGVQALILEFLRDQL